MKTNFSSLLLLALAAPAFATNYNGLLTTDPSSPAPAETCLLTITDSATGILTGKVTFAAKTHAFVAALDSTGHADVTIPRTGAAAPVPLVLSLQSDGGTGLRADISTGSLIASGVVARCPYSTTNPAPTAGRYVQMIGTEARLRPPYPSEVGGMTILGTGAIAISGRLSNGKAFTASAWLTSAGFPLFGIASTTPRAAGSAEVTLSATGTFTSAGAVTSSIPGAVNGSFHAEKWIVPARNVPVLPVDTTFAPNIAVWALAGPRALIGGFDMTLSPTSRATDGSGAIPPLIALSISKTTGLFGGWFDDGGLRRGYRGAIFPSMQRGIGVWNGGTIDIFTY